MVSSRWDTRWDWVFGVEFCKGLFVEFWFEVDLCGCLNNDSLFEDEIRQIEEDRAKAEAAAQLRETDYQLAYAIDILKGLSALKTEE